MHVAQDLENAHVVVVNQLQALQRLLHNLALPLKVVDHIDHGRANKVDMAFEPLSPRSWYELMVHHLPPESLS